MTALDALLAGWARPDVELAPWMAPYRHSAQCIASAHVEGQSLAQTLNAALDQVLSGDGVSLRAGRLRFVSQHELPLGEAYETFIARTACVPTRDNAHDLFNALVWMTFPRLKRHLNELQAEQLANVGVGPTRGPVRDALTVFDENSAVLQAPELLADALRRRDWTALFITHRGAWQHARLSLFGHALLEKLLLPRKNITAHVWLVPESSDLQTHFIETLTPQLLATKPHLPLPVLGVPGWCPANEVPGFYDDTGVFRPQTRAPGGITAHGTIPR